MSPVVCWDMNMLSEGKGVQELWGEEGMSTWIFRSLRTRVLVEVQQNVKRRSSSSGIKSEFGFGGR